MTFNIMKMVYQEYQDLEKLYPELKNDKDMRLNGFETVHNYIHPTDNILRKGAIRAMKNELVLNPY